MSTPEGRVKRKISALLRQYAPDLWYDMPVPGGFGKSTLDYVCCYKGRFFSIEAKRPGGKPTERQQAIMRQISAAGGRVFLVDGDNALVDVKDWLRMVDQSN